MPKNITQCPRPGLEPRPLDPESSALTMRPPRLPEKSVTRLNLRPCHISGPSDCEVNTVLKGTESGKDGTDLTVMMTSQPKTSEISLGNVQNVLISLCVP